MAFFNVKTDEESLKEQSSGNSKWINKSGMYEVVIEQAIVSTSDNGATSVDLWILHEDQPQMLFGAFGITNNDGSPNYGAKLFNKFCIVCGAVEDGQEIGDPVLKELPIGKGGAVKECLVLEEFEKVPVILRIQMEYSIYNSKIQERKKIRNVFEYSTKATADEMINKVDIGNKYNIEYELCSENYYKDDLTEEDIIKWKKDKMKGSSSKTKEEPATGKTFGQKRLFGKPKSGTEDIPF